VATEEILNIPTHGCALPHGTDERSIRQRKLCPPAITPSPYGVVDSVSVSLQGSSRSERDIHSKFVSFDAEAPQ
jgi:hypothetical protein